MPHAPRQLIGIDVGTTGVKAVLIDDSGRLLADRTIPHDLRSPFPGWAQEDPADWIAGTTAALQELARHEAFDPPSLAGIGVSGMVPAMILLDGEGRALRPSIQQNDARAHQEVLDLSSRTDQQFLYDVTGGFTNQQHIAPRLLWVQRNEPDVWENTRTILGSYDLVTAWLSGKPPAEASLELNWAIESGLYDIRAGAWEPRLLAGVGLTVDYFPPVRQPTDLTGGISAEVSRLTGIPAGTPVIAGSADHIASALAAGLRDDGDTLIKFGGAGDILYCSSSLITDPRLFIDAHDIPGKWLLNGCMAASGSLVKWYVGDVLGKPVTRETLRSMDDAAMHVPPGSGGVIVLPYFLGEKTPILDPLARGVIFGLDLSHGPAHIFRAILESVIFGFRHHIDVLREAGHHPTRYVATNGGVGSGIWRQIAADVIGEEIVSFPGHPGSSLGVAFVAGIATGAFDDWNQVERFLSNRNVNSPNPSNREIYVQRYATYRELYNRLKELFPSIA